jgi:hypothetical protein
MSPKAPITATTTVWKSAFSILAERCLGINFGKGGASKDQKGKIITDRDTL